MTPLHDKDGKHWNNGFRFHCARCKQERHLADLKVCSEWREDEHASRYYGEACVYLHHERVCIACLPEEDVLTINYRKP